MVHARCPSSTAIVPWHVMEKRQLSPRCQRSAQRGSGRRCCPPSGRRGPLSLGTVLTKLMMYRLSHRQPSLCFWQMTPLALLQIKAVGLFSLPPLRSDTRAGSCSGQLLLRAANTPTAGAERGARLSEGSAPSPSHGGTDSKALGISSGVRGCGPSPAARRKPSGVGFLGRKFLLQLPTLSLLTCRLIMLTYSPSVSLSKSP